MNSLQTPSGSQTSVLIISSILVLFALLAYFFFWSPNFNNPVPGGDYLNFYMAGQIYRHGGQDKLYDFDYQLRLQNDPSVISFSSKETQSALYIYPPFFVWFCLPFSFLPFKAGAIAWVLFMTACLIVSMGVLTRVSTNSCKDFGPVLLLSTFFTPLLLSLYSCQNATLSLLILSSTYGLLRSGRPGLAGAIFTLQAFKPQFMIVILGVMLWKRQGRFLLGATLGGAFVVGASVAVSPFASLDYMKLGPILSRWIDLPNIPLAEMSSWRPFWRLLLAGQSIHLQEAVTLASSLLTLALMTRSFKGPLRTSSREFPIQFSVLVLATVLISPHVLAYDLTVLLLPMSLAIWSRPLAEGKRARDPIWLLTGILFMTASISRWVAESIGVQIVVPSMLIYLVMLAEWSRRVHGVGSGEDC